MEVDIASQSSEEAGSGQQPISPIDGNTSGQETNTMVPPGIKGWNWGAFLLGWIWGIGNGTYISFLTLIPIVNVVMVFVLGVKGNEWAWKNKHWESIEHFKIVQRKWMYAGLIFLVIWVALFAWLFVFIFQKAWNITQPPVDAADTFLFELSSNQVDAAYASTSGISLNDFQAYLAANPILTEVKSESFNNRSINNSNAVIAGTVIGVDGSSSPISVTEVQQDGQWRIDGITL
jgi:hypothetical protein